MASEVKVGTYEGTGAAVNVELGWVPDAVILVNVEDGDIMWIWFNGMGASDAFQITNHADTQLSVITSNGVDKYEPTDYTNSLGFTVGTTLSESGKTIRYIAFRNDTP